MSYVVPTILLLQNTYLNFETVLDNRCTLILSVANRAVSVLELWLSYTYCKTFNRLLFIAIFEAFTGALQNRLSMQTHYGKKLGQMSIHIFIIYALK